MVALAAFGDDPEKIDVILPPGDPQEMLGSVQTKPGFHVYGLSFFYSYPPDTLETLPDQPANTLVEVATPYCFHVPSDMPFELDDGEDRVYFASKKVWTRWAEGSSDADFHSPTHTLFHNKTQIQSPNFPQDLDLGPDPICTGTNMEADRDKKGLYRYSLVRMHVDTDYPATSFKTSSIDKSVISDLVERALGWINRFIDVYRFVTKTPHVQRLPSVHVRKIFFRERNAGVYGASFGHGVRTAMMNRSGSDLKTLDSLLRNRDEIPPWELLFLDAQASVHNNQFTLAVVNAFQALELALQKFLEERMATQGLASTDVTALLDRTWRTKDRLKDLVPNLTGRKLSTDDAALWNRFCWAYDDVRNKLIHAARALDHAKTETAVNACRDVHQWLDSLP